jgi:hypothetical protein
MFRASKEVWGPRIELLGLILLLAGAFWQAKFSGWWDQQLPEWQALIQEDVNLALLLSVQNIAKMQATNDENSKKYYVDQVQNSTNEAYEFSITERDKRKAAMRNGQAASFWSVRDIIMILGAALIVVGKWFNLQHAKGKRQEGQAMMSG